MNRLAPDAAHELTAPSTVDPWLAAEYSRLFGLTTPLYTDVAAARAAGYRNVLVPETQLFLPCRLDATGRPPQAALGLRGGFNAVVTGIRAEYVRPVAAGDPFTVRARSLEAALEATKRVERFQLIELELVDSEGHIAVRNWLTVAELRG